MINKIEPIIDQDDADIIKNIRELMNKLDTVIDTVNRHEVEITTLKGGWTDVEIEKSSFKWPQIGDTVYLINSQGDVIEQKWSDSGKQRAKKQFLGVYKTREEANVFTDYLATTEL